MAEQLAACARQLFEGVSGSGEQRAANAWIMQFQRRDEAWQAALQLLETPVHDPLTHQTLVGPELVAMQILRLKTSTNGRVSVYSSSRWCGRPFEVAGDDVRADGGLLPVSCRIACVTLADIVVKSCKTWTGWKSDVQRLVDAGIAAQRQQKGAAVPVVILVHRADERSSALRCLEGWIVGSVPTHETFGLTAAHLYTRDNEEQAQVKYLPLILADILKRLTFSYVAGCWNYRRFFRNTCLRLCPKFFQSEVRSPTGEIMTKEQQTTACRGISRIACSLAMNHAPTLLWNHVVDTQASLRCSTSEQQSSLSMAFLELLLACSSYDDIDVVQPTLEIWFFFLEDNSSQSEASWQLLDTPGKEHVVSVLSRLVNALIERCKYPQWFVDKQQLVSDDPEIEAISDMRREIADTMLSLFSKWPGGPGKPTGDYASCVKGMCQMLSDSKDVALIDALLFLLSYMVELFDAISSDSESEDDPESFQDPESGGIDVLLGALDRALNLPMHPLVINGVARYLRSLSASLALPASVYLRASMIICQGLQYPSSYPVAVQSLLHSSSSITTLQTKTTQESEGDLLEVTFRFASGVSDADFGALCLTVLSNPTVRVQSGNPIDAFSSVYMLGRALGGVQDPQQGSALVDQLWSVVSASLLQHKGDESCRRAGVQFFLYVIPHLQKESVHPIEAQRLLAGFRSKLHDTAGTSSDGGILSMESFLSEHHEADKLIPEVEQFMKLAREVLSSFPQVLMKNRSNGEPTLYWVCLDLATRLLKVDHQMQEMCDAACDFLLDAMRCQPEPILERINIFASEVKKELFIHSYLQKCTSKCLVSCECVASDIAFDNILLSWATLWKRRTRSIPFDPAS
ncbi:Armadillo-type fold [Phytophthora cactorum]|nr:Armadillo-type fold [Phytophthora cactorum]